MSGRIPQVFLDDLLHRTDLVELIDSYVPLKKAGSSYVACCPFHNEKGPSFNVIAKKQFYHCFGCGESGNAISFVMRYHNQGFTDAVETLANRLGLTVPREGEDKIQRNSPSLYQLLQEVNLWYQKNLRNEAKVAIQYLKDRGLNGETAALYQLGYAPDGWHHLEIASKAQRKDMITTGMLIQREDGKIADRYRNRIMFPIHDSKGRIIGFGGRALTPLQKPKYLNSPETPIFKKSRELYGLHQVLTRYHNAVESLIVVEGYMDVIALAQHGIYNTVATLGTATSTWHIQLIARHTQKLIFSFDGDSAGRQAAWKALESALPHVHTGLDIRFLFLPEGEDPDSLVRKEGPAHFLQRISQALPFHTFFLDTLTKDLNLSTPAGKTQLIASCKTLFSKMQESSYKEILLDNLARLTHIESHRLNSFLLDKNAVPTSGLKTAEISRTPLRVALALLLQHPEIYSACKNLIQPLCLNTQELEILNLLIQKIENSKEATTANLLESFRDTPLFASINKLAAWDHQVPQAELAGEFMDLMLFFQKQQASKKIEDLLQKSRQQGLSAEEKKMLQTMLKSRHAMKT